MVPSVPVAFDTGAAAKFAAPSPMTKN